MSKATLDRRASCGGDAVREEVVACLESLVDAIGAGDTERARRAAEAEIDLLERSTWHTLHAVGGRR